MTKDKKHFVEIIPKSCGKYMSIMTSKNRAFLDSMQFLKASLDTLSVSLEDTDFKHLLSDFPADKLNLLKRKYAYPYEWFNDTRKFLYPRLLPKKPFHLSENNGTRGKDNKKNNRHISDERYGYLENVWNIFGFNTFRDFHNHYLKKDVLLLADAVEKFLNTALNCHNLDPIHHYSLPGFSWNAMLLMAGIKLDMLGDADKYLFIERAMRRGICYVPKRYSKANKEHCPDYDPTKPIVEVKDFDMNNLYGKPMSEYLPDGSFKWINATPKNIKAVLTKRYNAKYGYFLEVDIEVEPDYIYEVHTMQDDFTVVPETIKVTEDMLSPIQLDMKNKCGAKIGKVNKLIPNLFGEKNYIAHYRNLKYYIANGWKITKVHKILQFEQSLWLKSNIDFNTARRQEGTNESDRNIFKLMNNSIYGKTMENMRKRMNVPVITNRNDLKNKQQILHL